MDYMSLFPSASRDMPRFSAFAAAVLSQADDLTALVRSLPDAFSPEYAVGAQLSAIGAACGIPRPEGMADPDYRQLLLARLALLSWDGANDTAGPLLQRIFPGSEICDNCDGTVTVRTASPLQAEYGLYPLPAGVRALIAEE